MGAVREAPLASRKIAGKLGQKRATLGYEVSWVNPEPKLFLYGCRQPCYEDEARIELPIDQS